MPSNLAAVSQAQLPSRYQDVIKIALKPRQSRAFLLASVAWHLFLIASLLKATPFSLVTPLSMLLSLLSFGFGILPLLALRKRNLSATSSFPSRLAASRAAQLSAALSDPRSRILAYQHALAFVVLAVTYCLLLTVSTDGWAPQVWVESHSSFYVNERFLFLTGHAAVLGVIYTIFFRLWPSLDLALLPPFEPSYVTSTTQSSLKDRVLASFRSRIGPAAATGFLSGSLSVLLYSIVRVRIWRSLLVLFGTHSLARRLIIPSFRVELGIFQVAIRTTLFSMAAVCGIETAYLLLDVYLSHPLAPVSKYSRHPNKLLIDGINDPVLFFSNHAFSELARLCIADKDARIAIYSDVEKDVAAWSHLRDACIRVIDSQREFITRRGQPSESSAAAVAQSLFSNTSAATANMKQPATQPPRTVWDLLAAGESAATQAESTKSSSSTGTNGTTTSAQASSAAKVSSQKKLVYGALKVVQTIWKWLPADSKHVLLGPRRQQALVGHSPASEALSIVGRDSTRIVSATVALKELLCHSLDEDPYGTVQKDIKRVLTSLVDLSIEIRTLGLKLEEESHEIDRRLAQLETQAKGIESDANDSGTASDAGHHHRRGGTGRCESAMQLEKAWKSSGAQNVDMSLTAALRQILDTFGNFDLQLGNELEIKLSDCLG